MREYTKLPITRYGRAGSGNNTHTPQASGLEGRIIHVEKGESY
jgi:hypothetical protein